MPFGAQFVNMVTEGYLNESMAGDPTPDRLSRVRAAFIGALVSLESAGGLGGTLYVPRVGSGLLWIDVTTPLVIPANIELRLAHGVTLLPVARATMPTPGGELPRLVENSLEIQGVFSAPMARVFMPAERFVARLLLFMPGYAPARVRFASRSMERVHPEWWGAGVPDALGNTHDSDALDEAVRAAVHDRYQQVGDGRRWLRPLVIELLGTYRLSRPLLIARFGRSDIRFSAGVDPEIRSVGDGAVELRGAPGGPDTPTFVCTEAFPSDSSMVTVNGFEAAFVDEVRFDGRVDGVDGRERAFACLNLSANATGLSRALASPPTHGHYLRRCGFRGARGHLVNVFLMDPGPPVLVQGKPTVVPMLERPELHVEGCVFAPSEPNEKSAVQALRVVAYGPLRVDVRGCVFRGHARTMIYASACTLSVTNCQFRNESRPRRRLDEQGLERLHTGVPETIPLSDTSPRPDPPEGGLDIFLAGSEKGLAEKGLVATLYAQDCRTTSPQFLSTYWSGAYPSICNSTIVALHHVREAEPEVPQPAAIDWRIPAVSGSGFVGPRLTLIGCRFDRHPMVTGPAVRAWVVAAVSEIGVFAGTGSGSAELVVASDTYGSWLHHTVPTLSRLRGM